MGNQKPTLSRRKEILFFNETRGLTRCFPSPSSFRIFSFIDPTFASHVPGAFVLSFWKALFILDFMLNPYFWLKKELGIRKAYRSFQKGFTSKALDTIEELLREKPKDLDLLIQKAWCLADLKDSEKSIPFVNELLASHPENPVLHLIRGEILHADQKYLEAKESFERSLEISGENLRVEYCLGLVHVALGNMDKASQYFESIVKYDKNLVQSRILAMAESVLLNASKNSTQPTPPSQELPKHE